ncbi:hypothetical protein CSC41_5936 [Pseudomonas aeruginosa]|nr:hypothetical protein CSC41_5936 [Pseudomonas aeruginosa]
MFCMIKSAMVFRLGCGMVLTHADFVKHDSTLDLFRVKGICLQIQLRVNHL